MSFASQPHFPALSGHASCISLRSYRCRSRHDSSRPSRSASLVQANQTPRYDCWKNRGAVVGIYIDESDHFTVVRTTSDTKCEVVRSGYLGISSGMGTPRVEVYSKADASDVPSGTRPFGLARQLAAGSCGKEQTELFSYLMKDAIQPDWTGPVVYCVILPTVQSASTLYNCAHEIALPLGGPTAVMSIIGAISHALRLPWREMNGTPPHALVFAEDGSRTVVSFNRSSTPREQFQVEDAALPHVHEVDHITLIDVSEDFIPAALRDPRSAPPVHKLSHADVARGGVIAAVQVYHEEAGELFEVYHTLVRLSVPIALSIGNIDVAYKTLGDSDKAGSLRVRLDDKKLVRVSSAPTPLKTTIGARPRAKDNVFRTIIYLPGTWNEFLVSAIAVWTSKGVVLRVQAIDSASEHRVWQNVPLWPDLAELEHEERRLTIGEFHQSVKRCQSLAREHRATGERLRMQLDDEARAAGLYVEMPQVAH